MHNTVISDTSCLIVLTNIGELELLHRIYGTITTTNEVATEYGLPLPTWIEIKSPSDNKRQTVLELQIDKGEASAISLAIELADCSIILDDYKARKIAERLGLTVTGTIGVLVKAKREGVIESIKPLLNKIKLTDFRISEELEMQAIALAGEKP